MIPFFVCLQAMRVLGVLGALDPYKYKLLVAAESKTSSSSSQEVQSHEPGVCLLNQQNLYRNPSELFGDEFDDEADLLVWSAFPSCLMMAMHTTLSGISLMHNRGICLRTFCANFAIARLLLFFDYMPVFALLIVASFSTNQQERIRQRCWSPMPAVSWMSSSQ